MSERNDGGNAFPFFDERCMNSPEWGISMRDYFAAKAMQALVSKDVYSIYGKSFSALAYEAADAMLQERAK